MIQTDILIWITALQHPILDKIAFLFTFLGNEDFYFLILPLVYWCFSKKIGFRLLYVFGFSIYVNSLLKIKLAVARPVGVDGIHSIFTESAKVGSHYPLDSFPSGHAQGSTTLWGYLAYRVQHPIFWVISIALIFFISIFRLYTGLHWPVDVVLGILIGIIVIFLSVKLEKFIVTLNPTTHWFLAIITPLLLALLFPEAEGLKLSGFLLGAGVAYLLEGKYIKLDLSTQVWKKALSYVIGIIGLLALQIGLKQVLPDALVSDFIRYASLGIWAILVAPWLFIKLKLYPTKKIDQNPNQPPLSV